MNKYDGLDKIISTCQITQTERVLGDTHKCDFGECYNHCTYMLYFEETTFCRFPLIGNEDKQIEYSKWLEK